MSVNGTHVEAKLCTFTLESTHFVFILCPIYTHDGASANFSTNSQETAYSVRNYNQAVNACLNCHLKRLLPDEKYILDHDENQYFDRKSLQQIMLSSAKEVARMAGT